jgi:formylmethanofuran dehydrogenase subunit E
MMPLANLHTDMVYETRILSYSYDEYIKIVRRFHGYEAPGVIIGGFMVDTAIRNLPEGILYDAVSETRACLPDAIQLLTPCTIGNGWLRIIHNGRFALTLYDKQNYEGVRVFLDAEKVEEWQAIKAWYFKIKTKKEQSRESVAREIKEAGDSILSIQHVKVKPQIAEKKHKGSVVVCPVCHEASPVDDGATCIACQGNALYE